MKFVLSVVLCALLCCCSLVWATSTKLLKFDHFTAADGMPDDVELMYQDGRGFIWFATDDELMRYDGHQFARFIDGLALEQLKPFTAIVSDTNHNIWLAGNNTMAVMKADGQRFEYYRLPDGCCGTLYDLQLSLSGEVLLASAKGLFSLSLADEPKRIASQLIHGLDNLRFVIEQQDKFWLATNKQLYRLGEDETELILNVDSQITDLLIDSKQQLVVITKQSGFYRVNASDKSTRHYLPQSLQDMSLDMLVEDRLGRLWLGSSSGEVVLFSPDGTDAKLNSGHQRTPKRLSTMLRDKNDNIWLALPDVGIDRFRPITEQFLHLSERQSGHLRLLSNNTWALIVDKSQRLWVGLPGKGITVIDFAAAKTSHITNNEGLVGVYPLNFAEDEQGNMWVGTEVGINYIDGNTLKTIQHIDNSSPKLKHNTVYPLLVDGSERIWVGHPRNGLTEFWRDKRQGQFFSNEQLQAQDQLHQLFDGGDLVWAVSRSGITSLNKHNYQINSYPLLKSHQKGPSFGHYVLNNINGGLLDSSGVIWLSTATGLRFFDIAKKQFLRRDLPAVLQQKSIASVIEDNEQHFWIATGVGLFRYNPNHMSLIEFQNTDGVLSSYSRGVVDSFADGRIVIGGGTGVTVFDPAKLQPQPANIQITDFAYQISDQKIQSFRHYIADYFQFPSDINWIELKFSSLNFAHQNHVRYQHRILGISNDWTDNDGSLSIEPLKPGQYQLQIRASNSFGQFTEAPIELALDFAPPWYQSKQAWLLYAGALVLLGILIQYIRTLSVQLRARKLKALVQQRTADLEASNRQIYRQTIELEQASIEKDKFFETVSHEIRTPLTLILGPLKQLKQLLSEQQHLSLAIVIERNAERMHELVDQVLDFSAGCPVAGQQGQTNLTVVITRLLTSFKPYAQQHGIEMQLDSLPDCWVALSNDSADKLLSNLVSNAVKYSTEGGFINLTMSQQVGQDNSEIVLVVKDTGIGIDPSRLESIFERYHREDNQQVVGSGIGLATVKEIVEAASGRIEVESQLGQGTKFSVYLPMVTPEQDSEQQLVELPQFFPDEQQKFHLLLVDDNEDLLAYISALLSAQFSITTARNGLQGYDLARSLVPDIILSDVMMPQMDGFEMLKQVKEDQLTCHIPVVLLTAKDNPNSELVGLRGHADHYIAKPFDEQVLMLKLTNLIRAREAIRYRFAQVGEQNQPVEAKPDFLCKVDDILAQHYQDSEFGVAELASKVSLCQRQLLRKMKAVSDCGPQEYIRIFRLNQSVDLLTAGESVTSVAYEVGFSSVGYFRTSFKNHFGCTPSQYVENG